MKEGGIGGANTKTGLHFERKADLLKLLDAIPGYEVKRGGRAGSVILFRGEVVARCFKQHEFYKFLDESGVDWKKILSAGLPLDCATHVIAANILFVLDIRLQRGSSVRPGSRPGCSLADDLVCCGFNRGQYAKVAAPLGLQVEYIIVLRKEWGDKPCNKDVLDYIHSANCHYCFDELPLGWLGLAERQSESDPR
ncbi:MAG: hypothetical protein WC712_11075 [Candidatus Brocadiia bacterium]